MGGGKRKFNKVRKYVPKDKQLGKYTEDKEEKQKNPEDVKGLIDIWMSKKKKEENSDNSQ